MVVCYDAVTEYLKNGKPIHDTILNCEDVTKFITVRKVNGGAVWRGEELGRAVRYYYSKTVASDECIHYLKNNNRVPKSAGAKPLMNLPDKMPIDIDYDHYITEAEKLLCEVGYART